MKKIEEYKNKKVLITGGLGLIGSTTAIQLVEVGAEVTITDPLLPLYGGNMFNIEPVKNKLKVYHKDIRDLTAMKELVKDKDFIFNYAAQVSYSDSQKDPYLDVDINIIGHLNVLNACRECNKDAKIIFSGSRMQYGKTKYLPVNEDHPIKPVSLYGVHKNTAEQYYGIYFINYGIRNTCFRITNPYGPRGQMKHSKYSIPNWFIRLAMEDGKIKIFGDGSQQRDYIYVDDIVRGILLASIQNKSDNEVYNMGSGQMTTLKQMISLIIRTVGRGAIEYVPWPADYWNVETGNFVADMTKLKKLINWQPKIDIKEGIKKTVDYYCEHKKHYW